MKGKTNSLLNKSIPSETKRTALVFSGGGSRGAYECGVWQAIDELGIELAMVAGVSVGALNGVMVVQDDQITAANLWRQLETDMVFDVEPDAQLQDFAKEFFRQGGAGTEGLQSIITQFINEKKARESAIDFGLLTVEFPAMKPHYLWISDIPKGRLADYVTASASAFPAVQPYEIDGKSFIDGGYENNLPVRMALDHGATDIIAVNLKAVGRYNPKDLEGIENLLLIEPKWDLGSFLVFDTSNTKRIMRIGYLDAMKALDVYDGNYFTFVKQAFDKKALQQADLCAKLFELDPLILYRRELFLEKLARAVKDVYTETYDRLNFDHREILTPDKIKDVLKTANRKTLVVALAHLIAENDEESLKILKLKSMQKLLKDEIAMAKFLIKNL